MSLIDNVQGISPYSTKYYSYITDIIKKILKRFRYHEVMLSNLEYSNEEIDGLILPNKNKKRNIVLQSDYINNFNKHVKYYRLCVGDRTSKLYTVGSNFSYSDNNYYQKNVVDIEYFNSKSLLSIVEIIDLAYTILRSLPMEYEPYLYIGTTGCEKCRERYKKFLTFHKEETANSITLKDQYLDFLNTKHTIGDFLCEECKEQFEYITHILKYYSMDFEVKYELYEDYKDTISNYDGIIFCGVPYYDKNGGNCLLYGGQYMNNVFDNNERCIIDLDTIFLYLRNNIWDLNDNHFNKSNSILVIPIDPEFDGIAYTIAHIKRFDKFGRNIDIDISDRPLEEKLRSAKKFYNGYYLVKSSECIEYYNFSSEEPFVTRTLDEMIDWFNNNE